MKNIPSRLFLLLCPLIVLLPVFAQSEPQAILVGKYAETRGENPVALAEIMGRLARRLETDSSLQAYIVYFPALPKVNECMDTKAAEADKRASAVKELLIEKYKISPDRIVMAAASRFRYALELEFWLAPKETDKYTIGGNGYIVDCFCPQITISGSDISNDHTEMFYLNVSGSNPDRFSIKWKISTGKIISGQNTTAIEVDLKNVTGKEITIQVEVDGCCMSDCVKTAALTTAVKLPPQRILFDTYIDENRDLAKLDVMVDEFARRLNREPSTTKGYVIRYVPEPRSKKGAHEITDRISKNINRIHHFPADRIVDEFGGISRNERGFADYTIIEFWLVPEGAREPETRPEDADLFAVCSCPTLSIEGEELVFAARQPSVFTAHLAGDGQENATYKWTISDGVIVSGQGTEKISLDLSKAKHGSVTVKVEIGGLCADCLETVAEKIISVN